MSLNFIKNSANNDEVEVKEARKKEHLNFMYDIIQKHPNKISKNVHLIMDELTLKYNEETETTLQHTH